MNTRVDWSTRVSSSARHVALLASLAIVGCSSQVEPGETAGSTQSVSEAVTTGTTKGTAQVNCGGPASGSFIADADFSGGTPRTRDNAIDLTGATDPGPMEMYQSQRFGDFSYTFPGFVAGSSNLIRLHFADTHWATPGLRSFNVSINGKAVLSNFDIVASAGAGNKALIKEFTAPADSTGNYLIQFTTVVDAAMISGIEIRLPTSGSAAVPRTAQLLLPHGVVAGNVLLGAAQTLAIGDNVTTTTPAGTLLTSALGAVTLGKTDRTGGVVSQGNVSLNAGAAVSGNVTTGGTVSLGAGATVSGTTITKSTTLTPPDALTWNVTVPGSDGRLGDTVVATGREKILYPNFAYGNLDVQSGGKLFLGSGTYFFHNVNFRSGSQLVLESSGGLVYVYTDTAFSFDGTVSGLGGVAPQLLVGHLGTSQAHVGGSFHGTVAAPNAALDVAGTSFIGSLFAKSIQVASGAKLSFEPTPWGMVTGVRSASATKPQIFKPAPVKLVASTPHTPSDPPGVVGSSKPSAPVTFQIPASIPVSEGNAGNGQATLTFSNGTTNVTCSYRGGASTAHPTEQLDFAKGLSFIFQSCSNGFTAGKTTTGTNFGLTVQGDTQAVGASTAVNMGLGGGCAGDLPSPISPEQSINMVRAFDWTKTTALPETTADGKPTLFYANIYIRSEDERKLLDKFRIHWQARPIFDSEMTGYSGQCGTVSYRDDGEGLFVFAIIPGKTYNKIREATTSSKIRPEQRIMFKALVLRPAPAAVTSADGSLSYQALMNAGFYYLGVRDLPSAEALDGTDLAKGPVTAFVDAVEFVVSTADAVAHEATKILGAIDRLLQGHVDVTLDIDALNFDPRFTGRLTRAWGPGGGPIAVPGMKVSVMQWAQRIYTLGIPIPTTFTGNTDQNGRVTISVTKDGSGFGGGTSARGSSGVCVELANSTARMTSFILPDEVCDFPIFDVKDPKKTNTGIGFAEDKEFVIESNDGDLVNLAEITDAQQFYSSVVGGPWRKAKVLRGFNAAVLSKVNNEHAWCPALGFGSGVVDAVVAATLSVPLVSIYLAIVGNSDIILPPSSNAYTTRGVATHESGHYAFMNMINEAAGGSAKAVFSSLQLETMLEGKTVDPSDEARILNESFADFFASQAVSGANYWSPANSDTTGSVKFCNNTGNCLDDNDASIGADTPAKVLMKRNSTTVYDAFDGWPKGSMAPSNGDAWGVAAGGKLAFTPIAYGDAKDEMVSLTGPKLRSIVNRFIANGGGKFSLLPFKKAVAQTVEESFDWCQACHLFFIHEAGNSTTTAAPTEWASCVGSTLSPILGPPPDASLRLSAATCTVCPSRTFSSVAGVCTACPVGSIQTGNTCTGCPTGQVQVSNSCVACAANQVSSGNACVACPSTQVADRATNLCLNCPAGQIKSGTSCVACPADTVSLNNACVACGFSKGANRTTNTCDDCPDDFVVDASKISPTGPTNSATVLQSVSHAANDICPNQLWVRVINTKTTKNYFVETQLEQTLTNQTTCQASSVSESVEEKPASTWQIISSHSAPGLFCTGIGCDGTCSYHPADDSVVAATIPGATFRVGAKSVAGPVEITVGVPRTVQ